MGVKSGLSAEEIFERGVGITYDDVTVLDTDFTDIDHADVSLETRLGMGISLKTPIIAAPMDTVTNSKLCIALALQGGIGVIHYNHKSPDGTPDIEAQVREITAVKSFENGFIEHPITVSPTNTIAEAIDIGMQNIISGRPIDTFPVTYGGRPHSRLMGLLRKQDYSTTVHTSMRVGQRMIPLERLITAESGLSLDEANKFLWDKHLLYLPLVDKGGRLMYLVTRSDLDKNEEFPLATKDDNKRLRVLFAVGTKPDIDYERIESGFDAGADGVVVDTSQGFGEYSAAMIKHIQKKYPDKLLMGGNISTAEACEYLSSLGLHSARIGQGSGSICTTAGAIGISRAGAAAVYHCSKVRGELVTVADGGLRTPGDIFTALAIGAPVVMLGGMLAGTTESPGETTIDPETGLTVKVYRGMGSKEANVGGIRGYSRLPQGVSGQVVVKGSVHDYIPLVRDGLISAFHVKNCRTIPELHGRLYNEKLRFERRTMGSLRESGVHDLKTTGG